MALKENTAGIVLISLRWMFLRAANRKDSGFVCSCYLICTDTYRFYLQRVFGRKLNNAVLSTDITNYRGPA
jgi:prolipoprotein diacylglyceryltransferase